MKRPFAILALSTVLYSSLLAEDNAIPATVMVATEPTAAKEFKQWISADLSVFSGTYSGDVGGDSGGNLTFKVGKAKKDVQPTTASGTFTVTPAGSTPTVVKFEGATNFGTEDSIFTVGAFNIVFVNYGKTKGVIVGNVFLPKN